MKNFNSERFVFSYWMLLLLQIPISGTIFKFNQSYATALFGVIDVLALAYLLLFNSKSRLRVVFNVSWLVPITYSLWCVASFFWSVSDTHFFDIALLTRDFIRCLVSYLMVRVFGPRISWSGVLRAASVSAVLYAIVSLSTMDFINESEGVGRYSYESYKDSVGVSRQAAILCILAAGAYLSRSASRKYSAIGFFGCLVVCIIAFSKMALIALAMALLIAFLLYKTTSSVRLKAISFYLFFAAFVFIYKYEYILGYIYSPTGFERMSGRTVFWEGLLDFIWERPILGYGLNPVFNLLDQYMINPPGAAHNEVIQQLVSYGIIGLFLCISLYVLYFKVALNCTDIIVRRIMISLFVFFTIFGLTESVLVLSVFPLYFIVFFICIATSHELSR